MDDFKKILDEALNPMKSDFNLMKDDFNLMKNDLALIKNQLWDLETGLTALNDRVDSNTAAIIELESTIKAYADMYKVNNTNSKRLEKRIEVLEDQSGIIPPPEHTLADIS